MATSFPAGGAAVKKQKTMIALVKEYLSYRRSFGHELKAAGYLLLQFARFADHAQHHGPLTTDLMLQWVSQRNDYSARYRAERLAAVRNFARYLAAQDGQSKIPDQRLLGYIQRRRQPHIYTEEQLHDLLIGIARLNPTYPLRPHTYTALFGLMASTGLRISEALALQRRDVDLDASILYIRQSKFHKSRLVPMHPTVTRALRRYAKRRDEARDTRSGTTFFVGRDGCSLSHATVHITFRRLCTSLGLRSNGVLPRPRIHDLRHSFACRRLLQWYRDGVDVAQAIASLSTYLGHARVTDTYWYLSGTAELLAIAGQRFEHFAHPERRPQL
jgi:integrase